MKSLKSDFFKLTKKKERKVAEKNEIFVVKRPTICGSQLISLGNQFLRAQVNLREGVYHRKQWKNPRNNGNQKFKKNELKKFNFKHYLVFNFASLLFFIVKEREIDEKGI